MKEEWAEAEGEGSKRVEGVRWRGTIGRDGVCEMRSRDGAGRDEIEEVDDVEDG